MASSADQVATWHQSRLDALTRPAGNLALVAFQPVDETLAPVEQGVPASVRREGDEQGVWLTAAGADGVHVDGAIVDGEVFVGRLQADGHPLITWREHTIDVFSLDGSDYELRIYDAAAPNREAFEGIEVYPHNAALALTGRLEAFDETARVPWTFTRSTDTGHTKTVPGVLVVSVEDVEYHLTAFTDSGNLVLVFADGTTGESYAPGRFLRMDLPGEDGVVNVDFNLAFIPPCGFSDFYSCPIPPPENRIAARIEAGEKKVTWKGGERPHSDL